jgi:peptidoglycan/xylan/chitin deacetylase (PgdA/CDA1 family)
MALLGNVGAVILGTMRVRDRLVISFHGIGVPGAEVSAGERRYWCRRAVWPAVAEAMAEVAAAGPVALEITFDDGNLSDVEYALPVLQERGLTATFFVCAGRIGRERYLGEEELRTLLDAGMRVGSHGWSHVDLRGLTAAELTRETVDSRHRIAEVSATAVDSFAIPLGSYDRRTLRSLRDYTEVYSSDWMRARSDERVTPRFSYIEELWGPDDLSRMATERYTPLYLLRRALGRAYKRWR